MAKFKICFRVEQTYAGNIEVEAETAEAAYGRFAAALDGKDNEVNALREEAELDLDDSEDSVVDITDIRTGEVWEPPDY